MFIALESGRPIDTARLPAAGFICPVTIAELQAGVLVAADVDLRARRLATLDATADIEVLDINAEVAAQWARLRVHLAAAGRRVTVNDLWIAATAVANGLAVVTQDDDFEPLHGASGLEVIHV